MDSSSFPTTAQVRDAHPGELAVLLSTLSVDAVAGLDMEAAQAVVVATQKVASWTHGLQAVAVDRFAEHVLDAQEAHAAELVAARDAQREEVEAVGGRWRGETGALALPEPEQVAASMLAPELRISPRTMRTRLSRARALMELPTTLGLALGGVLEPWRVDAVVVASRDVAAERLVELEARLYATDVTDLPKPRLVERVRRAAAKADPESLTRGVARTPGRRSLRVGPCATTGLMRWTLEVPDALSARVFAAVDTLAQEYLTADQHTTARDAGAPGATGSGRERRTVEAARLDALTDLVMANAHVETVVELLVPVSNGSPTPNGTAPGGARFVSRPDPRAAAAAAFTGRRGTHRATDTATGTGTAGSGEDTIVVDLVLGMVTPDTLGAGRLERHHGLVLGEWLETAANPFLTHHRPRPPGPAPAGGTDATPGTARGRPPWAPPGGVWFVDGLVEAPGAAALLPEHITALLADPDTRLRITGATPGAADGSTRQRRTYRPGKALAATVRARDRHCRFPGCSVPARRCHLDHVIPHPEGQTTEANLQSLCPAHHGFKHHAGWTVTMTADGTCTWTTPTGRTHTTSPSTLHDTAA